ncbi:MAG: hypothetical protein QW802_03455 [Candidatus Altiarchaeota archaeon]
MIFGTKGQAGPLGEDLVLLIILILAIAILLTALNNLLTNYVSASAKLDIYRTAWIIADKVSTEWSYVDSSSYSRLLDVSKICKNCTFSFSNYKLNYKVNDLEDGILLCSCGADFSSTNFTRIVKLPVAIRFSQSEVHPGTLEVEIWK